MSIPPHQPSENQPPSRFGGAGNRFGGGGPADSAPPLPPAAPQMPAPQMPAPQMPAPAASENAPPTGSDTSGSVAPPRTGSPFKARLLRPDDDDISEIASRWETGDQSNVDITSLSSSDRKVELKTSKPSEWKPESQRSHEAIMAYLSDPNCSEIHGNSPNELFVKYKGGHARLGHENGSPLGFASEDDYNSFIKQLITASKQPGRDPWEELSARKRGVVRMHDGSSLTVVQDPFVPFMAFSIRKHNMEAWEASDLVKGGSFAQPMMDFVRAAAAARANILVVGQMGSGKAQPLDALVLAPSGWAPIGMLRVGDLIKGAAGSDERVTGVFPQGVKPSFLVTFEGDKQTRCCDEHLWFVRPMGEGPFSVRSLRSLMNEGLVDEAGNPRFEIPSYISARGGKRRIKPTQQLLSVKELDPCEMVCISTSAADELYVTDDYIVTHNTSLASILTKDFGDDERIALIEEVPELWIPKPQVTRFTYLPMDAGFGLHQVLDSALYMRYDRVIVGEVHLQGLTKMLEVMMYGGGGSLSTYHAGSAEQALQRMTIGLQLENPNMSAETARAMIRNSLELIVVLGRTDGEHRCLEIAEVEWRQNSSDGIKPRVIFRFDIEHQKFTAQQRLDDLGNIRKKAERYGVAIDDAWFAPDSV